MPTSSATAAKGTRRRRCGRAVIGRGAWSSQGPARSEAASARFRARSWQNDAMVPEAPFEDTDTGRVPTGDGWFVLNARDARWRPGEGRGAYCVFEGETDFPQIGIHLVSLLTGERMSMYHWEADQEDFLVLSGEAVLIIEGEERRLTQWDFVHCPAETKHTIVGAGDAPCLVLAVGARDRSIGPSWGGYTVDEAAQRHDACVTADTTDPNEAYARFPARVPAPYRDGWLPV